MKSNAHENYFSLFGINMEMLKEMKVIQQTTNVQKEEIFSLAAIKKREKNFSYFHIVMRNFK